MNTMINHVTFKFMKLQVRIDVCSEKEFAAGFGSHTPMVLGQAQVVRYYPNFERCSCFDALLMSFWCFLVWSLHIPFAFMIFDWSCLSLHLLGKAFQLNNWN